MGYLELFLFYLIIINVAGLLLMLIDKRKAQKGKYRIPEATLMIVAGIGGSIGSLIGMYAFRHKTRKKKFTLGIPAILAVQIYFVFYLLFELL